MTNEEIKKYIKSAKWQVARTMPDILHEYSVKAWNPDKTESFIDFVKYIQKHGKDDAFYGKTYRYFTIDNYKYWTMGKSIDEITLINREKI